MLCGSVVVQVAAKFLMRKLRQYPQTWQAAEMSTFTFFFYSSYVLHIIEMYLLHNAEMDNFH